MKVKFKEKRKLYFCYLLILMGFLSFFVILLGKPMKVDTGYVYDFNAENINEEIEFPLVQHIVFQQDAPASITIWLGESSKGYSYNVKLFDSDGVEQFNSELVADDNSNIVIVLENLYLEKDSDYVLEIDCDYCEKVNLSLKEAIAEEIYLDNMKDKTLAISINYLSKNNTYFWYSIILIVIGLTLLPVAKEENDEINQ